MKDRRKNLICLLCVLLSAALTLCACEGAARPAPELELSQELPGEASEGGAFMAELYFLSNDGITLLSEEREIAFTYGASRAEAAVTALIQGPESLALNESVPSGMTLQRVEVSDGVCNVYLLSSYMPDARAWFIARAAIAATVAACESATTANVLLNGVEPGYMGRPLGAASPVRENLNAYVAAMQHLAETGAVDSAYGPSYATLYFADASGRLLMAKNAQMNFNASTTPQTMAIGLASALILGDDTLLPVAPEGMGIHAAPVFTAIATASSEEDDSPHPMENVDEPPTATETSAIGGGEPKILKLELDEPSPDYDRDLLCGALTLTLTGYMPNIQGVNIVFHTPSGAAEKATDADYFTRADFEKYVGRTVYFYKSDDGALLSRVPRAIATAQSYDPKTRLEALLDQGGLPVSAEDVKAVYIADGEVVVDWKAGFTDTLKAYIGGDETRERAFVYTIVNMLTEMQGITGVWMLEEGQKLGVINELYLGNALMRNPGMIM